MAIAITIYFEGIRQLNSFYNQFMNDSLASFEDHSPMGSKLRYITDNEVQNEVLSLLSSQLADELRVKQKTYIFNSYRFI